MTWIMPQEIPKEIPKEMLTPPPRGCICPPGANKECENQYCPRKALPSITGGGR